MDKVWYIGIHDLGGQVFLARSGLVFEFKILEARSFWPEVWIGSQVEGYKMVYMH